MRCTALRGSLLIDARTVRRWYLKPTADRNIRPGQSPDMPTPMGEVCGRLAGRVGMIRRNRFLFSAAPWAPPERKPMPVVADLSERVHYRRGRRSALDLLTPVQFEQLQRQAAAAA